MEFVGVLKEVRAPFAVKKTSCMIFLLSPKSVARKLLVDGFDLQIEVSIETTVITYFFYRAHI